MAPLKIGISTCPNDTFAFHAIMNQAIDLRGLEFEFELLDVQELNERLFQGDFDVAKASFHAAILLADHLGVLPAGSALGFGVGPLLLAARPDEAPVTLRSSSTGKPKNYRVLCPGEHTTAHLLYRLFYNSGKIEQVIFSEIMPALINQTADFGVCIHEGRFTFEEQGLACVEDLGTRWEKQTGLPLPLGGILARHHLGQELHQKLGAVIRDSIAYGLGHREETLPTMRKWAQEFNDDVLMSHVDLYVNEWTLDLGEPGRTALQKLSDMALESEILPIQSQGLAVF
jgi:1,4-dihydroxy-6-naphthoate synthase